MGAAIGAVVGALLHLLVQLPGLVRCKMRYTPVLSLRDPGVRRVLWLMGPRVFGLAVVQLNFLVETNLASRLGTGAVAALNYALRVMLLPQGVFAQSSRHGGVPHVCRAGRARSKGCDERGAGCHAARDFLCDDSGGGGSAGLARAARPGVV